MNEFILLLLEKVFEAVYFSLFLICGKNIKEKRLLFVSIMIFEYLALKYFMHFSVCFHLIYTFMSFINLKVLYKEKAQITDIFLFMTASVILIFFDSISYLIFVRGIKERYFLGICICRLSVLTFLILFKNKINLCYNKYCKHWNRKKNNNESASIKSLTLRNISIIVFNLMFYTINIVMGLFMIIGWR